MIVQGFGEVLTDVMTVNPALAGLPSASSILDTSNYTFQAVTFGKDADGFIRHSHAVSSTQYVNGNSASGVSSYDSGFLTVINYASDAASGASSYIPSGTYLEFSSVYDSVPNYPSVGDTRLERASTETIGVSSFQGRTLPPLPMGINDEIFTFTADSTALADTGYRVNDIVTFDTSASPPPSGLIAGTRYWVVGVDNAGAAPSLSLPYAIRVSTTRGGPPITPAEANSFFLVARLGSPDFGHYANPALDSQLSSIWNKVGGFAPSGGLTDYEYKFYDKDKTFVYGGYVSSFFNANQLMDKDGYLTISPSSVPQNSAGPFDYSKGSIVVSALASPVSGGKLVVGSMFTDGDAATIAAFGGVKHVGVYCLDLKGMFSSLINAPI